MVRITLFDNLLWGHDGQHNDAQGNKTQHNDAQGNKTQHNDAQVNNTQHNGKIKFCCVSRFRPLMRSVIITNTHRCDNNLNGSKQIGTQHYDTQHNGLNCATQHNIFLIIMLTVIMLIVIMLTVIMLTVIMLTLLMLTVIVLSVILLTVIMLTVFMVTVAAHTQLRSLLNQRIS